MQRNSNLPGLVAPVSDRASADIKRLTLHGWWTQLFRHPDGPTFPPLPSAAAVAARDDDLIRASARVSR